MYRHVLPKESQLLPTENVDEHFRKNVPNIEKHSNTRPIIVLYLHGKMLLLLVIFYGRLIKFFIQRKYK